MPEINDVLDVREAVYGKFVNHADLSQQLKAVMSGHGSQAWEENKYMANYQREALEMICHKIARILNGDPNYVDSWVDISGYATLVVNELERRDASS